MKAQEQKSSMEQKEEKKDKPPNQNLIGLHKTPPTHTHLFGHTDVLST